MVLLRSIYILACKFKVVICDESHYLKSLEAARTKAIVPIIQVFYFEHGATALLTIFRQLLGLSC